MKEQDEDSEDTVEKMSELSDETKIDIGHAETQG